MSRRELRLVVGVVSLEFAAAVSTFVASTLLPVISTDLGARRHLGLLVAGSTVGMFTALPLAGRVVARIGIGRALMLGFAGYLVGTAVTVTAVDAWMFAAGQFLTGLAGGMLAVFGISAVISALDESLRLRMIAASSAMWILPALVGPAATIAIDHVVGWRVALLLPVPFMLVGRLLVFAVAQAEPAPKRPIARSLLISVGALLVVGSSAWPGTVSGVGLALVGVVALLPPGTPRLERGAPAALAAMTLFAFGYFGADRLVTVLLTDYYVVSLSSAAVVLSAAPLAWGITSLVAQRIARRAGLPVVVIGLVLAAVAVAGLSVTREYPVALVAWTLGGVGVGLAYPGLYVRCTLAAGGLTAVELATAVITAEAFGSLVGPALGGALAAVALPGAYAAFAIALGLAAAAAARGDLRHTPGTVSTAR